MYQNERLFSQHSNSDFLDNPLPCRDLNPRPLRCQANVLPIELFRFGLNIMHYSHCIESSIIFVKKLHIRFNVNKPFFLPDSGYTKLLVGLGSNGLVEGTGDIEIINLKSNSSYCDPLTKFPTTNTEAYGGLLPNGQPLICGDGDDEAIFYNNCYTYANKTWSPFQSMTTFRKHAAISLPPFSNGSDILLVTGGTGGKLTNFTFDIYKLQ